MAKPALAGLILLTALLATGRLMTGDVREGVPLVHGQSHESIAISGGRKISWRDAVGQKVTVQGIAWGRREKGLGDRVILDRTTIYVQPAILEKQGRLVEVHGTLEIHQVPPAPRTSQGFGPKGMEYYVIRDARCEVLDQISAPMLVLQDPDRNSSDR